jgi:S-adenosylmethionine-diacylgycerolhomoserine-N-methlytransferase
LEKRVTVQLGVAESWTFRDFNLEEPLDAVIFSYSLSMIDDWKGAVEVACRNLRPGGKVYAVDFGDQGGMPFWYRRVCNLWFDHFAFKRLYEMPDFFRHLTDTKRGQVQVLSIGWGHANAVIFTLPSGPGDPNQIPR